MVCMLAIVYKPSQTYANEPPSIIDQIAAAIRAGNAGDLAVYFGKTVEVIIPFNEGVYSKSQAEMILKGFFTKYIPVTFVVNQNRASAGGSQFLIGTYMSKAGGLNVYVLLKPIDGQMYIQQIHFEKE